MGLRSIRLLANSSAGQDGNGPNRGRAEAVVSIGYPVGGRSIRSPAPSCGGRIRSATPTMPSPTVSPRARQDGHRCASGSASRMASFTVLRSRRCSSVHIGLLRTHSQGAKKPAGVKGRPQASRPTSASQAKSLYPTALSAAVFDAVIALAIRGNRLEFHRLAADHAGNERYEWALVIIRHDSRLYQAGAQSSQSPMVAYGGR